MLSAEPSTKPSDTTEDPKKRTGRTCTSLFFSLRDSQEHEQVARCRKASKRIANVLVGLRELRSSEAIRVVSINKLTDGTTGGIAGAAKQRSNPCCINKQIDGWHDWGGARCRKASENSMLNPKYIIAAADLCKVSINMLCMRAEASGTIGVRPLFCVTDKQQRDEPPWMAGQGRQGTGMSPVDRSRAVCVCISVAPKTASRTEPVPVPRLHTEQEL